MKVSSTAASGLRSATTHLAVSAHNVANVSTEGFQPARAVDREVRGGGVTTTAEPPQVAGVGLVGEGVDLGNEIVQGMSAQRAFSANLAVLRTADEMTAELVRRRA